MGVSIFIYLFFPRVSDEESTLLRKQIKDLNAKNKILELEIQKMLGQININNDKVAMTACADISRLVSANNIIKFPKTKTAYGIKLLPLFQQSGVFLCQDSGLYLIAVTIGTYMDNGNFHIYKNNMALSSGFVYEAGSGNSYYLTGTAVLVVYLHGNDTVTIKTGTSMNIKPFASCLTIVKIE